MVFKLEIYTCPVCGKDTMYNDLCDWCYQVEHHIEHYLKSEEGKDRMLKYLEWSYQQ